VTVQTLTPLLVEQFYARPDEGVVVTQVQLGSIAAMAGIESGIVIFQVNHEAIANASDFASAVKESSKEKRILMLVRKDDMQQFVALSW
jgi:serine protease Do